MKYVIIGNSAAACGAVEGIRSEDTTGEIVLISDETHHTYSRPLISYLLCGKTDEQLMKYRPDDFYEKNNVKTMLGKCVSSIDTASNSIALESGEKISYDKLLVATGSRPFVPPMTGLESVEKKFCFMTLDEAKALDASLFPDARVLIVGAGLIGLKCAEGIAEKVSKITVVDLAPRILSSILDDEGASIAKNHLEKQGVEFLLGTSVSEFNGNSATLKTGEKLEFDILVTAVGVRPNTELVKDAGGEVERGIIVDKYMNTTIENVYAAGDCVESYDLSCGKRRILAILPNAYIGGMTAGIAMVNNAAPPQKAIPMNAIGFFGLHVITAGTYEGDVYEEKTENSYKKLFYSDDKLNGFILIGDVDKAGIYTSLIREQIPLTSIDFELICEKPSLLAFSRSYRNEKLGGKTNES